MTDPLYCTMAYFFFVCAQYINMRAPHKLAVYGGPGNSDAEKSTNNTAHLQYSFRAPITAANLF